MTSMETGVFILYLFLLSDDINKLLWAFAYHDASSLSVSAHIYQSVMDYNNLNIPPKISFAY